MLPRYRYIVEEDVTALVPAAGDYVLVQVELGSGIGALPDNKDGFTLLQVLDRNRDLLRAVRRGFG